jgi:hypothetical protein
MRSKKMKGQPADRKNKHGAGPKPNSITLRVEEARYGLGL